MLSPQWRSLSKAALNEAMGSVVVIDNNPYGLAVGILSGVTSTTVTLNNAAGAMAIRWNHRPGFFANLGQMPSPTFGVQDPKLL